MKRTLALIGSALLIVGCNQSGENRGAYSKQGGGSMEGAGGAGPGYDGTGSGHGKDGLASGSGATTATTPANRQTNNAIPNPTREKPPLPK
jgi:hypothetical protein